MLPNRLLVGAGWDWADVAGVRLPKRLDVGFGCPNKEDMVREQYRLLPVHQILHLVVYCGDVKFTFVSSVERVHRAAGTLSKVRQPWGKHSTLP